MVRFLANQNGQVVRVNSEEDYKQLLKEGLITPIDTELAGPVEPEIELPIRSDLKKDTVKFAKKHNIDFDKDDNEVELLEKIYKAFGKNYGGE